MPLAIDTRFLEELEGFTTHGIVPEDADGKPLGTSGVTVGAGIDLGAQSKERLLKAGVSPETVRKLEPYFGKKKVKAQALLAVRPLQLSEDEARSVTKAIMVDDLDKLISKFNKESEVPFTDLSPQQQTVLTSVHHQYGNLETETKNFWKQTTSGDWGSALGNLRDFKDDYSTRRNKEADYLERM